MGLVQALDDGILERSIQSGHIDLLLVGIVAGPKEVPGHPVYSQAVGIGKVCRVSEAKGKRFDDFQSMQRVVKKCCCYFPQTSLFLLYNSDIMSFT